MIYVFHYKSSFQQQKMHQPVSYLARKELVVNLILFC